MFGSVRCKMCVKPVYRMDPLINLDGCIIHKQCAKCGDCNCQITLSNFVKNEVGDQTELICKTHYMKRFNEGVGYPGGEKYKMKSTQSISGSVAQSTKDVESESFPSRKNLKPVSNSVIASESSTPALNSSLTKSASISTSVRDSSDLRRIESSTSGTTAISTDQSESDACAISLVKKQVVIGDEDETQASSETTSISTDDSCLSTAQVSPISDATRAPNAPTYKSQPVAQVKETPEPTAPASKTPGAEPGTVQNFRRLFSGSSKVTAAPAPVRSRFSITRKEVSFPEGQPSDTSTIERPKSWRSNNALNKSSESYVGSKSVLSRYAHNISEKTSTKILAPSHRASWTKQIVNAE